MYQVLARKWRPQNFDDLVGQEHVARTLRNAIQTNRLAHAYLFAGLRGTGKTTVARILAKCLNCEKGPTATPCDACIPCQEIALGRAMDVMEMDAASRTGVDDIRELQEVVSYAPVRDRTKVLIVDEAHMLSKQAFNALLKTLEEPPPRVVFVLATTELQKIIPTILSRCQLFEFRRVTPKEVAARLRKVCDAEGVRVSEPVLDRIARAGEGSIRDSLSLLERVLAFAGGDVSDEDALYVLGGIRTEVLADLLRSLSRRDAAGMLSVLDGLVAEGHDLLHVWSDLIGTLRDLILLKTLPGRGDLLSRAPEETATLEAAVLGLSREDLTRAFQILAELEPGLKGSSQPRFLFESALIRLADLGAVRPIEEILAAFGGSAPPLEPRSVEGTSRPSSAAPTVVPSPKKKDPEAPPAGSGTLADLAALRAAVHGVKPMLDAMLDEASSLRFSDRVLQVNYPAGGEALRRQVCRPEHMTLLRQTAEQIAGGPVAVRVETETLGEESSADESEASGTAEIPAPAEERQTLLECVRREPGVQKLLLEFGAQVVDIHTLENPGEFLEESEGAGQAEESS